MFSEDSIIYLDINKGRRFRKSKSIWKLYNILIKNQEVKEEIKMTVRKLFEINKNKTNTYQNS